MNKSEALFYKCPKTLEPLSLVGTISSDDLVSEGKLICQENEYPITNGIPNLTWPKELAQSDKETLETYERLASEYEKYANIPFETYSVSNGEIRSKLADQLDIRPESMVLEVGCGDGRGSEYLAKRLGPSGKLYLQELSPAFLLKAIERLSDSQANIEYSVANAIFLPFSDNTFDAAHHFGGMNTFSDVPRFLNEMVRVTKPGGKVVVGDESMAPWLRNTDFGRIMMNSNPLLRYEIPFTDIPMLAGNVRIEWIMSGAFFTIEMTVLDSEPTANYHVNIPSGRGGNHWTRYYGNLEGVTDETKKLAENARAKSGLSMHEWLDNVVKNAANKELDN